MSAISNRTHRPYLVGVSPRVCDCDLPVKELSTHKQAKTAIATVRGYWNVYVGFFGDQTMWLDFIVTDTRDGKVIWKNGRQLTEDNYGDQEDTGSAGTGRTGRAPAGEWIGQYRRGGW